MQFGDNDSAASVVYLQYVSVTALPQVEVAETGLYSDTVDGEGGLTPTTTCADEYPRKDNIQNNLTKFIFANCLQQYRAYL